MIYIPVGTKAQLIKMAPVIKEVNRRGLEHSFILTGQHNETMDDLIHSFGLNAPDGFFIKPDEADTVGKLLSWLFKAFFGGLRVIKKTSKKDLILVHGDTLSTLLPALIGKMKNIPVAHIEAGLRSYNLLHPFPEEIVRRIVSRLSSVFFCQDQWSLNNVRKYTGKKVIAIHTEGNTLLDSLSFVLENSENQGVATQSYCIVSLHRSENLSNMKRLEFLLDTVKDISLHIPVRFVLHPATRKKLENTGDINTLRASENIELVDRMNYSDFINLITKARFLVTDGGSNQEETSYLGLPCLLMRKATERKEGIDENVVLSNYDPEIINHFIKKHSGGVGISKPMNAVEVSPSEIIVDALESMVLENG